MTALAEFLEYSSHTFVSKHIKQQESRMYNKLKNRVLKKIESSLVDDFVSAALEILKP